MDEVRIVKHRTHIWPVIIALVVLALVIAYVLFAMNGPAGQTGWNDVREILSAGVVSARA
jgi:hypothetical protein